MKKVILFEPVLAHYRKDAFEIFRNTKDFEFIIAAGREYQGIKSVVNEKDVLFNYISFKLLGHTFYYLKGALKYVLKNKKANIICTGVDIHLIHTLLICFIHKFLLRRNFFWYSHATFGKQGKFGIFIRKFFYRNSDGILAYNNKSLENLKSINYNPKNVIIVRNSNNFEDYGFLNYDIINRKQNNKLYLMYSGRLTKEKKIETILKSAKFLIENDFKDFKFHIIGNGELEYYKTRCKELDIFEYVEFLGPKYGQEAHQYFLNSDLFIYPSGIGLSIVHALSFGLPIITTDKIELHFPEFELFKKDITGDFFVNDDADSLANKIIEWNDKLKDEGKKKYAENCINRIKELEYLPDKMSYKVIDFLKSKIV